MIDNNGIISTMYFDSILFKLFDSNKRVLNLNKVINIDSIEYHFKVTRLDGFLSNKSIPAIKDNRTKSVAPRQLRYILTGKNRNETLEQLKKIKSRINFTVLTSVIFTIHHTSSLTDSWEELRTMHFALIHSVTNCIYSLHLNKISTLTDLQIAFITNPFHRMRIITKCEASDILQFTLSLDKSWNKQCLKVIMTIKNVADIVLINTEKFTFEYIWSDNAEFDNVEFLSLLLDDTKIFNNGFVSDIYETFALLGDLTFECDLTKSNCEATHKFTATLLNDDVVLCDKFSHESIGNIEHFSKLEYPHLFTVANDKFDCISCPVISRCCGCCPMTTPTTIEFKRNCEVHHNHYMVMLVYALYILTNKIMLSCTGLFHNTTIRDVLEHTDEYKSQQIQWFQNKLE